MAVITLAEADNAIPGVNKLKLPEILLAIATFKVGIVIPLIIRFAPIVSGPKIFKAGLINGDALITTVAPAVKLSLNKIKPAFKLIVAIGIIATLASNETEPKPTVLTPAPMIKDPDPRVLTTVEIAMLIGTLIINPVLTTVVTVFVKVRLTLPFIVKAALIEALAAETCKTLKLREPLRLMTIGAVAVTVIPPLAIIVAPVAKLIEPLNKVKAPLTVSTTPGATLNTGADPDPPIVSAPLSAKLAPTLTVKFP